MSALSFSSAAGRLTLPRWLPLLPVFVLAIYFRHIVFPNHDVSWGLTMADKVLDGERLYVDMLEINPPATMYLYLVPAILGRLSGLPAEYFVDALVFLAAALSLWLCDRILRRAGLMQDDHWMLATICAAALLILPAYTFGEREHIAHIIFFPLLAMGAVRARGLSPGLPMAVVAGLCGGVTAIIKPHFAIPIVCVAAVASLQARSWRPLLALENWIAAALLAVYAIVVVIAYPQFIFDVMPMVAAVYLPAKTPYLTMLVKFATPCWLAATLLLVLLKRRAMLAPPYSLLMAASVGFLIAFYVQQKSWTYQSYPMLALVLIALMLALTEQWRRREFPPAAGRWKRLASAVMTFAVVTVAQFWMYLGKIDPRPLAETVEAVKPHPKIAVLSDVLWIAFPLTRMVEGTFIGRFSSLWLTGSVWYRRHDLGIEDAGTEAALDAYIARDKVTFAEDLARGRPDAIVVDHSRGLDWLSWANSYPPLAAQMKLYKEFRTVGDFDVLRREPGH